MGRSPILILVLASFTLFPSGTMGQPTSLQARGSFPTDRRFTNFLRWVLEIPNNSVPDQIAAIPLQHAIRNMMIQDWRTPTQIKKDLDFLNWQVALGSRLPEEREYTRINA